MSRDVNYTWRLAEIMAVRGLHNTTDLIPLLADPGITLSSTDWSPTTRTLALEVIAAICARLTTHDR